MIITRWQAPIVPSKQQLHIILESEGLEPFDETYQPQEKVQDHRHPFAEVRIIVAGEMIFNVSGNQFVLRPGDRLEIPANTKHSHVAQGTTDCVCVCAQRAI
ncbi:MAG: cupin domain-containing protein [Bdellovibrio sp.]|nr:cupin domain-containing protein [Bdellovibrio sp.]